MQWPKVFSFLFFLLLNTVALEAQSLPKEEFKLQGKGIYEWMWLDVYEAKLFYKRSQDKLNSQNLYSKSILLELEYFMDLDGKDIASQSVKEIASQTDIDTERKNYYLNVFEKIFPNVKKGDRISAHYEPKSGIMFYLNDLKLIGKIKDSKESKEFLNIWLGDKTSDPEFREKLFN